MASVTNFALDQGADFEAQIQVKDILGTPRNLTGYTFASQMRKSYTSSTAYNFVVTVENAAIGLIRISMTNTVTAGIKAGNYLFDLEMTDQAGKKTRVLEGQITVFAEVTR